MRPTCFFLAPSTTQLMPGTLGISSFRVLRCRVQGLLLLFPPLIFPLLLFSFPPPLVPAHSTHGRSRALACSGLVVAPYHVIADRILLKS
jgi:hypothetical protein